MKVAVIGVHGYLGKHLAYFLMQKGCEVEGYGRQENPPFELSKYIQFDITNEENFSLFNSEVDFVFYCAGVTGTAKAYDNYDKYLEVNEKGLLHLLHTLRISDSKPRIVFPSTRLVYKGVKNTPLNENAEKEFKTIYALNKWFGEKIIEQYSAYFNIDFTIFRICVPYGNLFKDNYSYGTIGFFLKQAMAGNDITLFGDGQQKRTFIHIEDICEQLFSAIRLPESINSLFNLGGETYALKEIAEKIAFHFGTKVFYKDWPDIEYKLESGDTIFDFNKIQNLIDKPCKMFFVKWLKTIK